MLPYVPDRPILDPRWLGIHPRRARSCNLVVDCGYVACAPAITVIAGSSGVVSLRRPTAQPFASVTALVLGATLHVADGYARRLRCGQESE